MNRRVFLKDSTLLSLSAGLSTGLEEIVASASGAPDEDEYPTTPQVGCAVIGLGAQGREILACLARLDNSPVVAFCDTYQDPGFLKRAQAIAPKARSASDYRKVLDSPDVKAVFVATPTHRHRKIVLDAIAAGKHVYCEAPLAHAIEDARAIAKAGADAKTVFQSGLQYRANKQHHHVLSFVRSQTLGHTLGGRGQWHKKQSWRAIAPTPEREREMSWRMYKDSSIGLPGEVGVHPFDVANWFFKAMPVSVTGFGYTMQWTQEGMQVPDTVQLMLEYPNNVRYVYDATLGSSFDGAYDVFLGSDCSMLIRDLRAWMFKETDSPLLGWEVYARKDNLAIGETMTGTGIALVADATKLISQGKEPGKVGTDVTKSALFQSVRAFLTSVRTHKKPVAGPLEGFQATVVAAKAHEAVMSGNKITFQKEWFTLS